MSCVAICSFHLMSSISIGSWGIGGYEVIIGSVLCFRGCPSRCLSFGRVACAFVTFFSVVGQVAIVLDSYGWLCSLLVLHLVLHKDSFALMIGFVTTFIVEERCFHAFGRHSSVLDVLILRCWWGYETTCHELKRAIVRSLMHADLVLYDISPLPFEFLLTLRTARIRKHLSVLMIELLICKIALI